MHTKYIVVTGGVLSGLGKGIAAASIGRILGQYNVIPMKLDGYLNVDPGTMNPVEHGEVFVLDDGGEVDMDFGHYERFLNVQCKFDWNLTMGKVFDQIRKKERRGDFLGQTVQFIPHVTGHIKDTILKTAKDEKAEIMLIEVGGTVGDIENELYIEACRELKNMVGKENICYVHLTYVPIPTNVNEPKTKPTQQSVALLKQRGIQPDIIIARCEELLSEKIKKKIGIFCDISPEAVVTGVDVDNVYKIPLSLHDEGITEQIKRVLNIKVNEKLSDWKTLLERKLKGKINIAICGKYTALEDSYASVVEALWHSATHVGCDLHIHWVETTGVRETDVKKLMKNIDGVIVPGGFGSRGIEGKIEVIKYCREHNIPYLGLCYGMQLAVIEYARNVHNMKGANSSEIDNKTKYPVIDLLPGQKNIEDKGATMRLGGHDIQVKKGTKANKMFGSSVRLRFRHRYEVNPEFVSKLQDNNLTFSGNDSTGEIMQIMELKNHKFFMATQAHPELTSKFEQPSTFFHEFVKAAK